MRKDDFADGGHGSGNDNHDDDGLIYIILGSDNLDFHIFVCCLINLLEIWLYIRFYTTKKYLFLTEFFPRKIFRQKFWIFPRNLRKENFPSEIFEKWMDFTHGQSFRRKVDISYGFYR